MTMPQMPRPQAGPDTPAAKFLREELDRVRAAGARHTEQAATLTEQATAHRNVVERLKTEEASIQDALSDLAATARAKTVTDE